MVETPLMGGRRPLMGVEETPLVGAGVTSSLLLHQPVWKFPLSWFVMVVVGVGVGGLTPPALLTHHLLMVFPSSTGGGTAPPPSAFRLELFSFHSTFGTLTPSGGSFLSFLFSSFISVMLMLNKRSGRRMFRLSPIFRQ